MRTNKIAISQYCKHYQIETNFVTVLDEMGILDISQIENESYVEASNLRNLERCRQLHYELNINPEGIDVILNLLNKQNQLQEEIQELKNRLKLHE